MKIGSLVALLWMVHVIHAAEPLVSLGKKSVGTLLGYDLILNGKTPVVELNVDAANYPDGVVPGQAKVKYLTTVWGRAAKIPISIHTTFVIYDEGHQRDAVARSPQGARAVAFAAPRVLNADHGVAMEFVDTAVFRLDRYLPPGRYQVFAFIDVTGAGITVSEVLPRGTYWFNPANNTDSSYVVNANGETERRYSVAATVEISRLQRLLPHQLTLIPKLSIGRFGNDTWVNWTSTYPDYTVEMKELSSTTWTKITKPGDKSICILSTHPTIGNEYGFQANFPAIGEGALLRLTPGGLTEATGEDLRFPVTQP